MVGASPALFGAGSLSRDSASTAPTPQAPRAREPGVRAPLLRAGLSRCILGSVVFEDRGRGPLGVRGYWVTAGAPAAIPFVPAPSAPQRRVGEP